MTGVYEGNRSPSTTAFRLRLAVVLWLKQQKGVKPRRICHNHQWYGYRLVRNVGNIQFDTATKIPHTEEGKKYSEVEESVGINTGDPGEGKIIKTTHHIYRRRAKRVFDGSDKFHHHSRSNKRSKDQNGTKETPLKQGRFPLTRIGSDHGRGDRTRKSSSTEEDKYTNGDRSGGDKKIKRIEGKAEEMGGVKKESG